MSILIALPTYAQRMQSTAEYFIAERTEQLLIYNKYQQRISQKEGVLFLPFAPMKILESQSMLNDDYTKCTKIERLGNVYYLIKNDKDILIGNSELGFNRVYRNAIIVQDTIRLKTEGNIEILSPDQNKINILQKGDILVRYFKVSNLTYVKINGSESKFGWIDFTIDVEYEPIRDEGKSIVLNNALSAQTMSRIKMKMDEANVLLKKLFSFFNKHSNKTKETPHWRLVTRGEKIVYVLESEYYRRYYQKSSQCLSGELENILLGTNYLVSYTPGKIEIQPK